MRGDCWESWPHHRRRVVSGRRTATRLHMREMRGDGVGNSAGPGEGLANRRYGARGGVSAVGSWTRSEPQKKEAATFPRLGNIEILVSENGIWRKPTFRDQASQIFGERKYPALLLPQHALSRKETQRGSLTRLLTQHHASSHNSYRTQKIR